MSSLLLHADSVLRSRAHAVSDRTPPMPVVSLFALILAFGSLYGALMGTFGGLADGRAWQIVFSAVKVPVLLLVTMGLNLPLYFVLHTLFGVQADFPQALRALVAGQAGLTVILSSLAPLTLLWYVSSPHYSAAILFNGLMFGAAALGGQWLMLGYYRPLLSRDPRHRQLLRLWLVLYAFVGIQMGWVLRPFIGAPWAAVRFFREDSWTNAYVALFQIVRGLFVR